MKQLVERPDPAALSIAFDRLQLFIDAQRSDGASISQAQRALRLHEFMLADSYSTAMRDAVVFLAARRRRVFNTKSKGWAALIIAAYPDLRPQRVAELVTVCQTLKQQPVASARSALDSRGGFDRLRKGPAPTNQRRSPSSKLSTRTVPR